MNKDQLLESIKEMAESGELTRAEVAAVFPAMPIAPDKNNLEPGQITRHVSVADILYYFGAVVAFVGVVILIGQNWDLLNDTSRIATTLGMGVVLLAAGLLLDHKKLLPGVAQSLILAGSLIFPVGVFVTLEVLQFDTDGLAIQSFIYGGIAVLFLLGYGNFKKLLLLIFSIAWVTAFYFVFVSFLFDSFFANSDKFIEYRILIAGVVYIYLGYELAKRTIINSYLKQILYALGIIAVMGSGFVLSDQNHVWEAIFPLLALGSMFASVQIRSRTFLIAGGLALIGYIFSITGKYFAGNVGWPVALIISGFALVGIGYVVVIVNKKYFSKPTVLDSSETL